MNQGILSVGILATVEGDCSSLIVNSYPLHPLRCRMVPHKTQRGAAALERLKTFEGVPPPYDKVKRLVVPDALKVLRLQHGHKFCKLGDLAASVGWKHKASVAHLEGKRKEAAAEFYKAKKELIRKRAKAVSEVSG